MNFTGSFVGPYPSTRLRRMRRDEATRRLMRQTSLGVEHLVQPVFVHEVAESYPVPSMPGVERLGQEKLLKYVERCAQAEINTIALFPVIADGRKSADAQEAYNPEGLVPRTIAAVKKRFPNMLIIGDVALDPYTSHGQDGLISTDGYVLNDETITVLRQQALVQAQAGADIVAPSDMMDGRVGGIRQALDHSGFTGVKILAYAAKYASAFYGPFRDAVGSAKALAGGDKKTYQMDPGNSDEALRETALDIAEGADMVMVKPAGPYLDVIFRVRQQFNMPTLAYQVSGEYAMLKAAAAQKWISEMECVLESLLAIRRAGAHGILTYYALQAAAWLKN